MADPTARAQSRAATRVAKLVRTGELPPVATQKCCKCGKPARYWHHPRGYTRGHEADVEPMCRKCHGSASHAVRLTTAQITALARMATRMMWRLSAIGVHRSTVYLLHRKGYVRQGPLHMWELNRAGIRLVKLHPKWIDYLPWGERWPW